MGNLGLSTHGGSQRQAVQLGAIKGRCDSKCTNHLTRSEATLTQSHLLVIARRNRGRLRMDV